MTAQLREIFCSVQGEGPYIGERHLFVRFARCHRRCAYCDTPFDPESEWILHDPSAPEKEVRFPNPVDAGTLDRMLDRLDPDRLARQISLTGGEPLLHAPFLEKWLPLRAVPRPVYLETAGDLPDALEGLLPELDTIAMDWKLPSVCAEASAADAHRRFLQTARKGPGRLFVKLVLSRHARWEEMEEALQAVKAYGGGEVPVVFQPVTPHNGHTPPSGGQLFRWQKKALRIVPGVRVIPQTHPLLKLL